jgi:hypothetical protein
MGVDVDGGGDDLEDDAGDDGGDDHSYRRKFYSVL